MAKQKFKTKYTVRYTLDNYLCGHCEAGVVQVRQSYRRGGTIHSEVSGCLDCGHDYGIYQAKDLQKAPIDLITFWP